MIGVNMIASDLRIGRRWISVERVAHGGWPSRDEHRQLVDPRVERVVDWDRDAAARQNHVRVTLEDGEGARRQVVLCRPDVVTEGGRRIVWTDPLPDDDAVAVELVRGALLDPRHRRTTLLWIGATAGGLAYGHVVTDDRHHNERGEFRDVPGGMRIEARPRLYRLPEPVAAGDLVAIVAGRCEVEEGRYVHVPKVMHGVARGITAEQAASLPVPPRRRSDFAGGNFDGPFGLEEAEGYAEARTQPSEALVLVYEDGDTPRTTVLSSTGIAFHNQDDVAIYLEDRMPGPGLWAFTGAVMTAHQDHEGGWDQDLDGDAAPADDAFVLRHFGTRDDLVAEIIGATDETMDVDDLMRQARKADAAERAASAARAVPA